MFQQKVPKREQPDAADLVFVSTRLDLRIDVPALKVKSYTTYVSIDPATDNFGFRIERRYIDPFNPEVCSSIETLAFEVVKFRRESQLPDGSIVKPNNKARGKGKKGPAIKKVTGAQQKEGWMKISHLFKDLENFLYSHHKLISEADIVVVERQMVVNYVGIRVQQHVLAYFSILYPGLIIIDQAATVKTQFLGAPTDLNKRGIKKWSIAEGTRLLTVRNDKLGLQKLRITKNKLDDMTDTIVQVEAFCVAMGLPLTNERPGDSMFILDDIDGPATFELPDPDMFELVDF